MTADPYRQTATEVLARIRQGDLTVEQYARSLLSHIQCRDPIVRAWAYLDADHVIEEAKALDQVPMEARGPLHGIAIGVKDVIYTKDMPTQFNSSIYQNDAPKVDAASIMILRTAGALIFGKTTTTEFAATTRGPLTTNPHDPSRTPGGSSSGSGAAVGDFQVPISLGTQTGGSTIRPGSFNGIYALKPTWNSISREGQKMYSIILDTVGLYARSVADLDLLAEIFKLDEAPEYSDFQIKGAKFGIYKSMVWEKAGPGTVSAMKKAVKLLEAQGAKVEEIRFPDSLDDLPSWHHTVMTADGRSAFLPEYYVAKDQVADMIIRQIDNVHGVSRADQLKAFDNIAAARPIVDKILADYAAVLTPSVPDEAPKGIQSTGSAVFNCIWTALHTPVLNVPGFQGEFGMPIGVSLVAPRYKDRQLLAVGSKVGQIFEKEGGWKPKNL